MADPAAPNCRCCHDARTVLTAEGETRPCSRCCSGTFSVWMRKRTAAAIEQKNAEKEAKRHA